MGETEIAAAHAQLAARQLAEGAHGAALQSLSTALALAPGVAALWAQFAELVRYFNFRHPADPVRDLLARALEHPAVDPGDLVRPVTSIALSHPQGALAEPLLLRLLEDVVIRDPALERTLTEARRRMLREALPLSTMVAIAHQCFNTEYVFEESAEERAEVERLRAALISGQSAAPERFAAYAAYRPLLELGPIHVPIPSLALRQVDEPLEERRLAEEIPAMRETGNAVSAAVRSQYEANPYPRWVRMAVNPAPAALGEIVRELFPGAVVRALSPRPRILVAGCGTGQNAIATAQRFAGSSVLAVDLSRASLGYAARKTRALGVRTIEYRQADILDLARLEERFDLIECSGVLHHLEDPLSGWRILAGLRKPGGLMRVGLYSETGRRQVVRARELIAARGFAPDADGIRACRAAIREDPSLAQLARNEDFYSMSGCRDLLFHAHERRFNLLEIEAMLAELGLRFLGFEFPDSGATLARYRAKFSGPSLRNWHAFEQEHPDTFARMYQFWVS